MIEPGWQQARISAIVGLEERIDSLPCAGHVSGAEPPDAERAEPGQQLCLA
jgi:hypothetical protein